MKEQKQTKVQYVTVHAELLGQRIDNYLIKILKGVPKSYIYRIVRQGQVRVNRKRVAVSYKLQEQDEIRIPPIADLSQRPAPIVKPDLEKHINHRIIYEDDDLIVINKPAGIPVHGGSGLQGGIIDILRCLRPKQPMLELVHRLDKDTSGCLLIAKKRSMLCELHEKMQSMQINKRYLALVKGQWPESLSRVDVPLRKQILQSGERMVKVDVLGSQAVTLIKVLKTFEHASLLEISLLTGRTHQIRVHCAHSGHPVVGDEKYGDKTFNKASRQAGLKRMFLHAQSIDFVLENGQRPYEFSAELDEELKNFLQTLGAVGI